MSRLIFGRMRLQYILITMMLFLLNANVLAGVSSIDRRYQQSVISIKNSAPYPVVVTIESFSGAWAMPVSIKTPIILAPNQHYLNTLISENTHDGLENYVSIEVAQLGNERENYLIFGESANSRQYYLSSHIFDGLSTIFVNSDTNHCDQHTPEGYA